MAIESLENVERISEPSVDGFWSRYVLGRKPVIITDLFRGQPIRSLSTAAAATQALGDMGFVVQWNYTAALRYDIADHETEPETATLGEYLDYVELNPATPRMAIEQPAAPKLRATYETPALCRSTERAFMFIGNAGNYAHLHFDGDQRHVLMYQVFGAKRVVLIPPREAKLLLPNENFSSICVQELSEREKRRFFEYTGAHDCIVRPGETILMPSLYWHYLEYLETSMSLHLRFGQNRFGRFLDLNVHRNMYTQNVAARFADERFAEGEGRAAFAAIEAEHARPHPSPEARFRAMNDLFRELYRELCPDAIQGTYAISGWSPGEEESGVAFYRDIAGRARELAEIERAERSAAGSTAPGR